MERTELLKLLNLSTFTAFDFEVLGPEETKVTWSFEGELGSNPISRIIGLFLDDILGQFYDAGLTALRIEAIERSRLEVEPVGT